MRFTLRQRKVECTKDRSPLTESKPILISSCAWSLKGTTSTTMQSMRPHGGWLTAVAASRSGNASKDVSANVNGMISLKITWQERLISSNSWSFFVSLTSSPNLSCESTSVTWYHTSRSICWQRLMATRRSPFLTQRILEAPLNHCWKTTRNLKS